MESTALKVVAEVQAKDMPNFMPHRFENLLVDKVTTYADNPEQLLAVMEVTISENDALGRQLFLVKNAAGSYIYNSHVFPEVLALGALVYLNTVRGKGYAAYFSTISNFQRTGDIQAGEKMTAKIYLKRGKGAFQTFYGKIQNSKGEIVAETDVMAFVFLQAEAPADNADAEKKKSAVPELSIDIPVDFSKIHSKDERMFFAERLVAFNDADLSTTVSFTYAKDHPFVKGHFPGNPIMMGVCQWMSAADAIDSLALQMLSTGKLKDGATITADVELVKDDGTLISEFKDVQMNYTAHGQEISSRLISTKKCGYRDRVIPGTRVYQRVTNVKVA